MKRILQIATLSLLVLSSARAYDLPLVNLGLTSFLDGAPPAGPGFYFQNYFMYYHAEKFADANGRCLDTPSPKVDIVANLFQGLYQSNQKVFLGGKWGVDVILPIANFSLDQKNTPLAANGAGIGDLVIGPYLQWDPIMGKNGPIFMHRVEFQMMMPIGRYDRNQQLNPGSNFFSIDPYWAATWFPTPKCELSWRLHYLWNDENTDPFVGYGATSTQAGQAIHLNFATSYELIAKRLRAGINGYYLTQITDSKVNGNDVAGREEVVGIGPGLIYSFSQNDHIFLNAYFEVAAQNRTEGQRVILRWTHHF